MFTKLKYHGVLRHAYRRAESTPRRSISPSVGSLYKDGADAVHPHRGSAMRTKKLLPLFHFAKNPPVATLETLRRSQPGSASAEAREVA
jgi:hypothetical protein